MKSFISAMVIAAFLVCGGISFNIGIDRVSGNFISACDEISAAADAGDFDTALTEISDLSDSISRRKTFLLSTINHEVIDEIEVCVSELYGYAQNSNKTETEVRCLRLKHLLKHLPENYSVNAQNIL